jgi:cobalamin biosynthetic protein CobC
MARALGPWSVPGLALEVGRVALADDAWQTAMRTRLAADAERLRALLVDAGFDPVGGTPLYQLVRHADAAGWHDRLARHGVWVRAFPYRSTWLRFGLPGDPAGWERLAAALAPGREPSGA